MNSKFAESTLQALRKIIEDLDNEGKTDVTPIVWIHDYQLLVAATHIRHVSRSSFVNVNELNECVEVSVLFIRLFCLKCRNAKKKIYAANWVSFFTFRFQHGI